MKSVLSIIESPAHPDMRGLFEHMKLEHQQTTSMRKAISSLKTGSPDYVFAEFRYGYGNNYAGVNVSNLDVFLYSLQKSAPEAKVVVLVEKEEFQYVEKLEALFELHAVLVLPVKPEDVFNLLQADLS